LGFYVGADDIQPSWSGLIKHVNLIFGGNYLKVNAENVLESAPKYDAH
jgi:hypothetical protein